MEKVKQPYYSLYYPKCAKEYLNLLRDGKTYGLNEEYYHSIKEELMDNIKNPFGGGNCDATASRVDIVSGDPYTTLKCGDYLIDNQNITPEHSLF